MTGGITQYQLQNNVVVSTQNEDDLFEKPLDPDSSGGEDLDEHG